jgi:hypothetical protein
MGVFTRKLHKTSRFLFDFIILSIAGFLDFALKAKVLLTREDYIGKYLSICNASEIRMMFGRCIAGGYTGFVQIKLFSMENCSEWENCAEEILNHEVLHQVVYKVAGWDAKQKLDRVHQTFYVLDLKTKKWEYVVGFIAKEGNGSIIFI